MNDQHEAAFRRWQDENRNGLMKACPEILDYPGVPNNYDHWCRLVYTGRIQITIDNSTKSK